MRFNVNPRDGSLDDVREQTLARLQERLAAVPGVARRAARIDPLDALRVE